MSAGKVIESKRPAACGPDDDAEIDLHAAYVLAARRRRYAIEPLSRVLPLTIPGAQRMRNTMLGYRLASGERCAGWRVGIAAAGADADAPHRHQPSFGLVPEHVASRHRLPTGLCQPTVFADIALTFGAPIGVGCDERAVIGSITEARLALSVVERVLDSTAHTLEDAVATDLVSPSCVVVGDPIPVDRLASTPLRITHPGPAIRRSFWQPATTSLADDLFWLADQLASIDQKVLAGHTVFLSWLRLGEPTPGSQIVASAGRTANVSCYYPPSPHPPSPTRSTDNSEPSLWKRP